MKDKSNRKMLKKNPELKEKLRKQHMELNGYQQELKRIDQIYNPVEFRELTHPSKAQVQGIAEMWVEVLTAEDATKLTVAKMQTVK